MITNDVTIRLDMQKFTFTDGEKLEIDGGNQQVTLSPDA